MYAEWESKVNDELEGLLQQEAKAEEALGGTEAGNGRFYEALGQAFATLEQNPEAIWAYQKAVYLNPWNRSARESLQSLQHKLGLPPDVPFSMPLPFLYEGFALFFVLFLALWRWKGPRVIFASLSGCLLLAIAFEVWIAPLEGVLIRSTYLYQSRALDAPLVAQSPLVSGLRVEVLDTDEEGKWLKVKDGSGNIGFISYKVIRII